MLTVTMTNVIPDDLVDLLERPLFGSLGTVRPDGAVQVNPMWFEYDGRTLRFTHTTKRSKYRNLRHNPSMSLSVFDPDQPLRYLEVRGKLSEVIPDSDGDYFLHLARRYCRPDLQSPADKADRVVLVMSIDAVTSQRR
jgi:PPOX class probable F420-dependent enzyme